MDAKGQNCPIPVVMAKKEIDGGAADFLIEVDNSTAVENLQRLADSQSYRTTTENAQGIYTVTFTKAGDVTVAEKLVERKAHSGSWAVFAAKDILGAGDAELGHSLIKMFFYTLSQSDDLPASILFMNAGVKLPSLDDQIVEHLRVLADKGVEILVCGTCLNFYGIADKLQIGTVSNMYDIVQRMQGADKVISL
ncbi:sulfurtransferase-like selenium metabolism protein YedF [Oscillospiraceae bacterium PP1C4]